MNLWRSIGSTNVARTFSFEWSAHHRGEFETRCSAAPERRIGRWSWRPWEYRRQNCTGQSCSTRDVGRVASASYSRITGRRSLWAWTSTKRWTTPPCSAGTTTTFTSCRGMYSASRSSRVRLISSGATAWSTTRQTRPAHTERWRDTSVPEGSCTFGYTRRGSTHSGLLSRSDGELGFRIAGLHALQALSTIVAGASVAALGVYRAIRSTPGLRPSTAWGIRTVRSRTFAELKLTWFDALSPEFDTRHSESEVIE